MSQTYRLMMHEGIGIAANHIWSVLRKGGVSLLFIDVSGYIAEVNMGCSPYSGDFGEQESNSPLTFHRLSYGESLPPFCYGITQEEINRRINAGHRCYVIREAGKVVCSCWIGFGTISYGGPSVYLYANHPFFDLEPGQAWLYESICEEKHRRKGLATLLKKGVLSDLKRDGVSRITATTGEDNIANIKALLRSGFILKEFVRYRRWLIFRYRYRKVLDEDDIDVLRKKVHLTKAYF